MSQSERSTATTFLVRPHLDAAALTVLVSASLDTITTYAFVLQSSGIEQNPLLRKLILHSPLWIPIYLLARPILVLFMDFDHRIACAVWGSIIGFSMTINNLFGLISGNFVLYSLGVDWICIRAALPIGALVFMSIHLYRQTSPKTFFVRFALLCLWFAIAEAIEQGFWWVASIVSQVH